MLHSLATMAALKIAVFDSEQERGARYLEIHAEETAGIVAL